MGLVTQFDGVGGVGEVDGADGVDEIDEVDGVGVTIWWISDKPPSCNQLWRARQRFVGCNGYIQLN